MSNRQATATDWNAVKPALYEAAKGHWFELDSLFNERDELIAEVGRLREALQLLVDDVQDYEAWQRPCHALDVARAALSVKGEGE